MRTQPNPEMNDFERALVDALLAGSFDVLATLRVQFERATAVTRELSGCGFFLTFAVEKGTPLVAPPNFELSDVYFDLAGTEFGGGAILFVRDGVINMLEGYSHGSGWPDEPTKFVIRCYDGPHRDLAMVAGAIINRRVLHR